MSYTSEYDILLQERSALIYQKYFGGGLSNTEKTVLRYLEERADYHPNIILQDLIQTNSMLDKDKLHIEIMLGLIDIKNILITAKLKQFKD
jgi:hypothetical protein